MCVCVCLELYFKAFPLRLLKDKLIFNRPQDKRVCSDAELLQGLVTQKLKQTRAQKCSRIGKKSLLIANYSLVVFFCRMCGEYQASLPPLNHQRPARSVRSCALTQAAVRDTLNCPTCRCTAGNTQVRRMRTIQNTRVSVRGHKRSKPGFASFFSLKKCSS